MKRQKPVDPRFRLNPGQTWFRGARVTRVRAAARKGKRR